MCITNGNELYLEAKVKRNEFEGMHNFYIYISRRKLKIIFIINNLGIRLYFKELFNNSSK